MDAAPGHPDPDAPGSHATPDDVPGARPHAAGDTAAAEGGLDTKLVAMFAAGGIALAVVIIVIGSRVVRRRRRPRTGAGDRTRPDRPDRATGPDRRVERGADPDRRRHIRDALPLGDPGLRRAGERRGRERHAARGSGTTSPTTSRSCSSARPGRSVVLMSDVGGGAPTNSVTGLDLTFDDEAPADLPDDTALAPGDVPADRRDRPRRRPVLRVHRRVPARRDRRTGPSSRSSTARDPNGEWQLFVVDDSGGDDGRITGGGRSRSSYPMRRRRRAPRGPRHRRARRPTRRSPGRPPRPGTRRLHRRLLRPGLGVGHVQDASQQRRVSGRRVRSVGRRRVPRDGDLNTRRRARSRASATSASRRPPGCSPRRTRCTGVTCRAASANSLLLLPDPGRRDVLHRRGVATARREPRRPGTSAAILTGTQRRTGSPPSASTRQGGVALRLSVNGELVDEVVDATDPLGAGAVGLPDGVAPGRDVGSVRRPPRRRPRLSPEIAPRAPGEGRGP